MLTGKQRAYLRKLAADADTIVHVGKNGVTDAVVAQTDEALEARELVKGRVLDNVLLSSREACDLLAQNCGAEIVQVIGSKFVLYRRNAKEPKILLPRAKAER
jgi:RNA-binding protein